MITIRFSSAVVRGLLVGSTLCLLVSWPAASQVQSQQTVAHAAATQEVKIERGEIVYVSGNDMMVKMESVFGAPVLEAYGMTEASHQMCSNPRPPAERKPGSVGPGTGIRVSIMDAKGNHMPQGERGEVVIQGPNVVDGYENNPEANAASFTNGWFRTGDQGFLDEAGYLTLTGRIKELINRGGEKIAPREIDEVLLGHPAIAEAVAFGFAHPTWGEEVAAAVVLKEPQTENEILAYCKDRLADFKRPKKVYIVETIPRTATGKIQRGAVAKALAG